ncbi:energy transducer TonB [Massilia scottii]|uniref:energy transducer TonB n=1 Tax=Massilia scottii TaxID=3057166 RepID=UPI0027965A74|nr:TonB C-terminal domain-containing protein [Massilia sp. CCM 9029]MDQ1832030.1 TonB C-terminal domain-containing protein [Massilia sp. CCM 9029]
MRHFLSTACLLMLAQPAPAQDAIPARIRASVVAGSCPAPQWPGPGMRIESLDTFKIALVIAPDGRVLKARLEQSGGGRPWDEAVIKALSACRFLPGRRGGKPVQDIIKMQYVWTLD